ncbi:membrane-associated transporter protein-like [Acanthaster planci]|uniref:Membrane-associated transporter protein-like n=1 Tax=Acanthaster planci TaxID=133434 RepID=A0A8B7YX19_ACAPL|nr:membrane-associated transporter protein-like [Acanthaster planci]
MVSGRVSSACSRFWTSTKSLIQDCMPRRVLDDVEPIIAEEERQAVAGRLKSRLRLARLSGAVCGIEFCYAAETAFVSPVLLRIGIPPRFMTLIWCLSPLLGLFLMPLLGSASDRCKSSLGRRRPFIILLSIGVVFGLLLVPYGWPTGRVCDVSAYRQMDKKNVDAIQWSNATSEAAIRTTELPIRDALIKELEEILSSQLEYKNSSQSAATEGMSVGDVFNTSPTHLSSVVTSVPALPKAIRFCGMALTILGVMMLDFNCDAAQSPARAYLIDVTDPADHAKGLATFSFMAGLGGAIGYAIGGIPWGPATDDDPVSLQVRVVFSIVLFIFVLAVLLTVTAEREQTLYELFPQEKRRKARETKRALDGGYEKVNNARPTEVAEKMEMGTMKQKVKTYGSNAPNPEIVTTFVENKDADANEELASGHSLANGSVKVGKQAVLGEAGDKNKHFNKEEGDAESDWSSTGGDWDEEPPTITIGTYLLSIVFMPWSLRILCLTHLLGWMSLLCYSLYFTDFVGQAVYGGDPTAAPASVERLRYADGVRMGSFAMAMYSITCSICSYNVDRLINKIGARPVYICNHLIYSISMVILANVRTVWAAFLFSACAGIQYSTLFTLPFVIVAHYHSSNVFETPSSCCESGTRANQASGHTVRGLGTDIALVQGMVFVAQLALSSCMGSIVQAFDSTVVVVVAAAILSFLGAIFASQVTYAGL